MMILVHLGQWHHSYILKFFPPPCCGTAHWPLLIFSPPTFIFLKFSRALSICGVSIQPVSVREPLLLSALLCSVTLHIWRPSIPKSLWLHSRSPRMFKLLQETELLDLFIQLSRLRRDTPCLQLWPATRWLLWLVCINKKRQIITTNSFIKLTGNKTERDHRVS